MENEKVKIYVTKRVAEILEKDAETFEFMKRDGITPNKNAFITALIVNYWQTFKQRQGELNNMVESVLKNNTVFSDEKIKDLTTLIVGKFNKETASDALEKFDCLISLKPTRESRPIIDYIEEYMLENCTLSEYFRNMFVAYTSLPQDMREKIIFKEQYNLISEAIKKGKRVFVSTKGQRRNRIELQPYMFSPSKEELHIYLLYKSGNACKSLKLARIETATIIDLDSAFCEDDIKLFNKMLAYGVQFSYSKDEEPVVVKLTQKGQSLFHKIYVHRPIPASVDKNIYTFNCSYIQIIQYFTRFGREAEIISPRFVKDEVFNFHNACVRAYSQTNV